MKVIVAGGRDFTDKELLFTTLDDLNTQITITEIVCGGAKGADSLGKLWALSRNIKVIDIEADWERYGKSAGFIRNRQMGDYADYLVAFWNSTSPGTKHMIEYMKSIGKHGTVIYY